MRRPLAWLPFRQLITSRRGWIEIVIVIAGVTLGRAIWEAIKVLW